MNQHLTEEQFIGYVYRTLTDAQRETIEDHLVNCQQCLARLTHHRLRQRQIDHHLRAEVEAAYPSPRMTFAAITPRLKRQNLFARLQQPLVSGAPATVAVAGLVMALVSLGQTLGLLSAGAIPTSVGPLPALACFCFAFSLWGQFERRYAVPPRFFLTAGLAFVVWVGTAIVGLQNIVVIRELFIWGFVQAGGAHRSSLSWSVVVVLLAAILYIAAVLGGGEYHYRHLGQRRSWVLFAWTIAAQWLILLLGYLI